MKVEVISFERVLIEKDAASVTVPGSAGSFTVLENHAPIVSSLSKGRIEIDGAADGIEIESGIVHVRNNIVKIYVQ